MTSLLEKAISVIAPHRCIICGNYNNVVCTACAYDIHRLEAPLCVLCGSATYGWEVCASHHSPLAGIFAAGAYDDVLKAVIRQFKFEHARAAHRPLAEFLTHALPYFDNAWTVVAIPTIPSRIRQRGYDHAALLARELARQKSLPYLAALGRAHDSRQVGATRAQRARQMEGAFFIRKDVANKNILLIDDVCTTGATLQSAAHTLRAAGAVQVWAAVVAYKK